MTFEEALVYLKKGEKIKRGHENFYWKLHISKVICAICINTGIQIEDEDPSCYRSFSDEDILANDWEIFQERKLMGFKEAMEALARGKKISRKFWGNWFISESPHGFIIVSQHSSNYLLNRLVRRRIKESL